MNLDRAGTSAQQGNETAKAVIFAFGRGDAAEALRITEQVMGTADRDLLGSFVGTAVSWLGHQFRDWVLLVGEQKAMETLQLHFLDPDWDPKDG